MVVGNESILPTMVILKNRYHIAIIHCEYEGRPATSVYANQGYGKYGFYRRTFQS